MKRLLAALVAVVSFGVPCATASAAPFELGLQDDLVFVHGSPVLSRDAGLDYAQRLGVRSVRMNIIWSRVIATSPTDRHRPAVNTYNWGPFDAAVDAVRARGLQVQLTVTTPAPAWATADKKLGVNRPDPKLFAQFAVDTARHFDGRIRSLSIMNEPNWPTWIKPKVTCKRKSGKKVCDNRSAKDYRAIYRASYSAVKQATPNMPVWIGELAPQYRSTRTAGEAWSPIEYLREVLCVDDRYKRKSCAGLKTDGVAVHPYYLGKKPTDKPKRQDDLAISVLGRLDKALTRFERLGALRPVRGRTLPVYLTEYGYHSVGKRRTSEANQAKYLKESVRIARRHPRVRQLLHYQLVDPFGASWQSGILRSDGTPKPAVGTLSGMVGSLVPRPVLPLPPL